MTEKRKAAADPYEALKRQFSRLAGSSEQGVDSQFWKRASEVDYRTDSSFQYDMEWKDVSVLVNALKDKTNENPDC
jgi:hypothetical protein